MTTLSAILSLLRALPEILKLIEVIDKRIKEQKLNKQVHEDIVKIQKAFEDKDEAALKALFNS